MREVEIGKGPRLIFWRWRVRLVKEKRLGRVKGMKFGKNLIAQKRRS